jgi:hypothetical protein
MVEQIIKEIEKHNNQLKPTSTALLVLCFSATLAQNYNSVPAA